MHLFLFQTFFCGLSLLFGNAVTLSIPPSDQSLSIIENAARSPDSQLPGSIEGHFVVEEPLEQNTSEPHFLQARGQDLCGPSTFVNQGSEVSPFAEHCLQIIRNVQGDPSTSWRVYTASGHRTIAQHETCRFGVERYEQTRFPWFEVGGQDVQDVINDAVRMFKRPDGRIGAKGVMNCRASGTTQAVLWGIF